MQTEKIYWTSADVMKELQLSYSTFKRLKKNGILVAVNVGGSKRYLAEDIYRLKERIAYLENLEDLENDVVGEVQVDNQPAQSAASEVTDPLPGSAKETLPDRQYAVHEKMDENRSAGSEEEQTGPSLGTIAKKKNKQHKESLRLVYIVWATILFSALIIDGAFYFVTPPVLPGSGDNEVDPLRRVYLTILLFVIWVILLSGIFRPHKHTNTILLMIGRVTSYSCALSGVIMILSLSNVAPILSALNTWRLFVATVLLLIFGLHTIKTCKAAMMT